MADAAGAPAGRGGFGSRGGAGAGGAGGDRGRGGRGGPRGRGRGRRGAGKDESKEWQPVTKLGRLVKAGKITSMEEIYLHSLPIKEYQIVDHFLPELKDEVMKVRTRRAEGRMGGAVRIAADRRSNDSSRDISIFECLNIRLADDLVSL